MPGGAKQANTLKSTLWEITVKMDLKKSLRYTEEQGIFKCAK